MVAKREALVCEKKFRDKEHQIWLLETDRRARAEAVRKNSPIVGACGLQTGSGARHVTVEDYLAPLTLENKLLPDVCCVIHMN